MISAVAAAATARPLATVRDRSNNQRQSGSVSCRLEEGASNWSTTFSIYRLAEQPIYSTAVVGKTVGRSVCRGGSTQVGEKVVSLRLDDAGDNVAASFCTYLSLSLSTFAAAAVAVRLEI